MKQIFALLLFLLSVCLTALSQQQPLTWGEFVENMYEEVKDDEDNLDDIRQRLIDLEELHRHPFNFNTATSGQLSALPFLDNNEIDQILLYLSKHRRIDSWGELLLIKGLRFESIRSLPLFCTIGEESTEGKTPSRKPTHSFDTRLDVPLYTRKGFMWDNKLKAAPYVGDKLAHRMHYRLQTQRAEISLYANKSTGERYYDNYGGYVALKNIGFLDQILIGDYRIGFGEGLVIGRGSPGKSNTNARTPQGIRAQQGFSETYRLRGIVFGLNFGAFEAQAFASARGLDGTMTRDSAGIQTLITNGYHRTQSELDRKNALWELLAGGHVQWNKQVEHHRFFIGASGLWRHTTRPLIPRPERTRATVYRDIYPQGQDWGTVGVNYGWSAYRWSAAGETATSFGGWGTVERISYKPSGRFEAGAVFRYYSDRFQSAHATSLSENSRRQNETGVLLRLAARPWDMILLESYADFFYFHWPRFGMSSSDSGQDIMGQISVAPGRRHHTALRYNLKRKSVRDQMNTSHRLKLQYAFTPHERLRWQCSALLRCYAIDDKLQTRHLGWGLVQNLRLRLLRQRLQGVFSAGYFDSPAYLCSIYLYEPALWNSTDYTAYYGQGIRSALTLRWSDSLSKSNRKKIWMLELKYGVTYYFDRDIISSALQQIFSPLKQDVSFQLRFDI